MKTSAQKIAEHFGTDIETVRDHEYQPGSYSSAVYMIDDLLYAATKQKPKPTRPIECDFYWKQIQSSYDPSVILWQGEDIGAGVMIESIAELAGLIRGKDIYIDIAVIDEGKLAGTSTLQISSKQAIKFYEESGLMPLLTCIDEQSIFLSTLAA